MLFFSFSILTCLDISGSSQFLGNDDVDDSDVNYFSLSLIRELLLGPCVRGDDGDGEDDDGDCEDDDGADDDGGGEDDDGKDADGGEDDDGDSEDDDGADDDGNVWSDGGDDDDDGGVNERLE